MTADRYRVGVDVGGTFTDVCVYSDYGARLARGKALTTAPDPSRGLRDSLEKAAGELGLSGSALVKGSARVTYGTTVATNAVIENRTASVGLLCSAGFRDVLWFREGGKEDPFDWHLDYPPPYIPRRLVRPVEGRINAEGEEVTPLAEDDVVAAVEQLKEQGVEAVAVAFLWSLVNPYHELRAAEIVASCWPGVTCVMSHEVNPIPREYRRTIATAIDASLHSIVGPHLSAIRELLASEGFDGELHVVSSQGGVMPMDDMIKRPVLAVGSGPTMGPVAGLHAMARAGLQNERGELRNAIVGDMGGTSFDVSLIRHGHVPTSRETIVGDDLLGVARIDIRSVGAGGGSVAWVDQGGLLRVGPDSAGSDPGPACYGRAGADARPTVTDANVVLGYLGSANLGGTGVALDSDKARLAMRQVADPLGWDVAEAADVVRATATQLMVNEVDVLMTREGVDPAATLFVAGGGACGLHAAGIAEGLGIDEVLIPQSAGTLTAFGALVSDVSQEFTRSWHMRSDAEDLILLTSVIDELRERSERFLQTVERDRTRWAIAGVCEARYVGQVWELEVPVPEGPPCREWLATLLGRFHELHEQVYGIRQIDQPVECLTWRVKASARSGDVQPTELEAFATRGPATDREVFVDGEYRRVPVWHDAGSRLESVSGPALVEQPTTTIYVPSGWCLRQSSGGDYAVSRLRD
jgi:N-methylhydantoinase A